jgi:hypothetical protein
MPDFYTIAALHNYDMGYCALHKKRLTLFTSCAINSLTKAAFRPVSADIHLALRHRSRIHSASFAHIQET